MSGLKYKTRNNTSPKGKPRVYFCCHPEDFDKFFSGVSEEILAKQNCAVWYAEGEVARDGELLDSLKEMQLFVMPVTSKLLLSESYALDIEFKLAKENHIPVLPLMQENGLAELFNNKCGELQFLDKNDTDATAISYEEKLKKYLSSVLIGDELAEKIRSAFDAYVFLSYRKKDRKYAQELMRLIHKNDFCRDIAIWYDEFLVPGENFNDSIKEALKKSKLFVLTVTPNLVNETNYIMTTEYPMAKEERKPILPAELVPTDKKQLLEKYEDIPQIADAHNEEELSQALLDSVKGIAIRQNDASPEHNFFIGLAYLGGVDVEVDYGRALRLITDAAENGVYEAQQKMVDIYVNGIGVERDYERACQWMARSNDELLKELTEGYETIARSRRKIASFGAHPTREELEVGYAINRSMAEIKLLTRVRTKNWCKKQMELAEMWRNGGNLHMAQSVLIKTVEYLCNEPGYDRTDIYSGELISEPNSIILDTTFFDMHERLIELFASEMKFSSVREWQERLNNWIEELRSVYSENAEVDQFKRNCSMLEARFLYLEEDFEGAKELLLKEIDSVVAYMKTDDVPQNIQAPADPTVEDVEHFEQMFGKLLQVYTRVPFLMDFLSDAFMLLGDVYVSLGMKKEAFNAYDESVGANDGAQHLLKEKRGIIGKLKMAQYSDNAEMTEKLLREVEDVISYSDADFVESTELKREFYRVKGELALIKGEKDPQKYFDEAIELASSLLKVTLSIENLYYLTELYGKKYLISQSEEQKTEALKFMYDVTDRGILNATSPQARQILGQVYLLIHRCNKDKDALLKARDIFLKLSQQYPESRAFKKILDEI